MESTDNRNHMYSFERLDAWNMARSLSSEIYNITYDFPDYEKFGLCSQIRRCTISIASNIVEGNAKFGAKEKTHFFQMAYGSCMELLCQLIISRDLGFISEEKLDFFRRSIEGLTIRINGLQKRFARMK